MDSRDWWSKESSKNRGNGSTTSQFDKPSPKSSGPNPQAHDSGSSQGSAPPKPSISPQIPFTPPPPPQPFPQPYPHLHGEQTGPPFQQAQHQQLPFQHPYFNRAFWQQTSVQQQQAFQGALSQQTPAQRQQPLPLKGPSKALNTDFRSEDSDALYANSDNCSDTDLSDSFPAALQAVDEEKHVDSMPRKTSAVVVPGTKKDVSWTDDKWEAIRTKRIRTGFKALPARKNSDLPS